MRSTKYRRPQIVSVCSEFTDFCKISDFEVECGRGGEEIEVIRGLNLDSHIASDDFRFEL